MAGFFKKLFGSGGSNDNGGRVAEPVLYGGYIIRAEPKANNGQYNIAGTITREDDPEGTAHQFIRADTYASLDDAVSWSERKAKQIIDEQGERLIPKSKT